MDFPAASRMDEHTWESLRLHHASGAATGDIGGLTIAAPDLFHSPFDSVSIFIKLIDEFTEIFLEL